MKKLIIAIIIALTVSSTAGAEVWKHKQDLMPPRDAKVEQYLKSVPEMDERYLVLDQCYTKGELASTMQIARLQEPDKSRSVHLTSMMWVLTEQLAFPEEVIEIYVETFNFVWDTFSMTEKPGYVHWVTHNECIKKARAEGKLDPLTPEQQKELDEIESRYHHLKTSGTRNIGGFKWLPATVTDSRQQSYCAIAGEDALTILPLKRAGVPKERVMAGIDTEGLDKEYVGHWMNLIDWVYSNDYDYALEYRLHATLDCLNFFDKDEPI